MKNTLLVLAALLSVTAPACAWDRLDGQFSQVRARRTAYACDEASWKQLWAEHAPGAAVPEVDFEREGVAAVFLGEVSKAAVKVDVVVSADPLDASRVVVFYRPVAGPGGFAAAVISRPFAFVKVRKAASVHFEENGSIGIPEGAIRAPKNPVDGRRIGVALEKVSGLSFDGR